MGQNPGSVETEGTMVITTDGLAFKRNVDLEVGRESSLRPDG